MDTNWKTLTEQMKAVLEKKRPDTDLAKQLSPVLGSSAPETIALAMENLEPADALSIFPLLEEQKAAEVLAKLEPGLAGQIMAEHTHLDLNAELQRFAPREAAAVVAEAPAKLVSEYMKSDQADPSAKHDVEQRLQYRKGTAGRLMTTQFVHLYKGTTIGDAIEVIKHTDPSVDIPDDLYIVEKEAETAAVKNRLLGVISIRDLLMHPPEHRVDEIMAKNIIYIQATASDKDAAALISKYQFMTLPVVDEKGYLVGVIPTDDLFKVAVSRASRLYNKAVGTDTEAMEQMTPWQAARQRIPWLLGTMVVELLAGMVISHFDGILKKVILLASFMPVISAVSGNVGLQAAAITVRALDSGPGARRSTAAAVIKELSTSLLMAMICGLVLGTTGAIWARHLPFGIVIGCALTCSMITAGFMGTCIPVFSKRLGFDPATTAGPFETAFQDIVGFAVFLWLATLLQQWIT